MKKYTTMKIDNESKPNLKYLDQIGLNVILKSNQLDEQITKPKRLDWMIFPPKTEPI